MVVVGGKPPGKDAAMKLRNAKLTGTPEAWSRVAAWNFLRASADDGTFVQEGVAVRFTDASEAGHKAFAGVVAALGGEVWAWNGDGTVAFVPDPHNPNLGLVVDNLLHPVHRRERTKLRLTFS